MAKKIGDTFCAVVTEQCDSLPSRPASMLKYFCKDLNKATTSDEVLAIAQKASLLKGLLRKEGFYEKEFDRTLRNVLKKYRL